MSDESHIMFPWLGSGGKNPGVEAMDPSGGVCRLIELAEGQSVYALAVSDDLSSLAIGTRSGEIYLLALADPTPAAQTPEPRVFIQGAPVLSICFVGASHLVAGDTAGRCLRWNGEASAPGALEVGQGVILSLLKLPDGELAGLSSTGELVFWQSSDGSIVRTAQVPAPVVRALVSMTYWPAEESLVYPGHDGLLVSYNLATGLITLRTAHDGEFLMVAVAGDELITVGRQDEILKRWRAGVKEAVAQYPAPGGAVSGFVLDDAELRMVLVSVTGTAGIYRVVGKGLELQKQLPGRNYRIVASPPLERVKVFEERRRRDEAGRVVSRIKEAMDHRELGGLEALHVQLIRLGYEHVSLSLRADQARRSDDLLAELRYRRTLAEMLPAGQLHARASLQGYASLLESVWLYDDAKMIEERIRSIDSRSCRADDHLTHIERLRDPRCIIQPDIPIPVLIKAATVLGRRFERRCCLNELDPVPCRGIRLAAEVIADKYEQLRPKQPGTTLPAPQLEDSWWLSRDDAHREQTILFFDGVHESIRGLGLAYQIRYDGLQTVVVPAVLLDARRVGTNPSPEVHNHQVALVSERINDNDLARTWLTKVDHAMRSSLRRLVTAAMSERDQQKEPCT